ncbi:regulatory protein, FmdB family [Desulfovibrio sp. X2]|uniref:FmdB family zinc ribbon protein n=1 Tax=Desulfovibrio sp. X2 TaxID=941449 RepID=UPI000358DD4C|nr:zinc ribbon domain-containing protein [Desulfovibrio sp. X2]EPR43417.1 regulatory protein, FmdB family [Desulfovibrio sp. X2]
MPMYEYVCEDCGREFEELGSMRDETAPCCPGCGSAKTTRLVSRHSLKTGASPFKGLDSVKQIHPAARPAHLNRGPGGPTGGCGGCSSGGCGG